MTQDRRFFAPVNPAKYVGDVSRIRARSSWELHFMQRLDRHQAVTHWAYEPITIPYLNPMWPDRVSKYIPDFVVWYARAGTPVKAIIEIKPVKHFALASNADKNDLYAYIVNQAKWKSAREVAARDGATFRVLTMESLGRVNKFRCSTHLQT